MLESKRRPPEAARAKHVRIIDLSASLLMLALTFGGLLFIPHAYFWLWFAPLFALWVRFNYVMLNYD